MLSSTGLTMERGEILLKYLIYSKAGLKAFFLSFGSHLSEYEMD